MGMTHERGAAEWTRLEASIDRDAEVPIGVQLDWALRSRIRDGSFQPGQRLPTLREMAEATGLNINTVRAVYQRLERKGLISSQQGSGTFVRSSRDGPSSIASIAANAVHEARETGVDPREVAAALYVCGDGPANAADQAAARRRTLRTQIAALERAIGEIETEHADLLLGETERADLLLAATAGPSTLGRRGPGPTLLSARELEQVRTQLIRRLTIVQSAIDGSLGEGGGESAPNAAHERRGDKPATKPAASKTRKRAPRTGTRPAPAGA